MSAPVVVKLGGGLRAVCGEAAHERCCSALGALGRRHRLLVVPGGGAQADAVRERDRREGLTSEVAHRLAIEAMDGFGAALAEEIPGGAAATTLAAAGAIAGRGRVAVLLPAALLAEHDPLPASWEVTSDAIAAWIARERGAARLVFVKGAAGVFRTWPPAGEPLAEVGAGDLAALGGGGLDAHLPRVLRGAGLDVRVVGGPQAGAALRALLDGDRPAPGTRIADR